MRFKNKTVVVTGACSGIGKIMARKALEREADKLVVLDLNKTEFSKLQQEWEHFSASLFFYQVDLSQLEEIKSIGEKIRTEVGAVDVLINNAGIVTGKYFHEQKHTEINKAMLVNAQAMMHLTLEILPGMLERNTGAVANICSLAGLISNTKMSVYAASKWAAVGWSDSLWLEMKQLKKDVKFTTIMPYYIDTGMFEGVKSKMLPILKPEAAAEKFIRAVEREKRLFATPTPYWFIRLSQGILPLRVFDAVMGRVFGIYDTMKEFKGWSKKSAD